MRLLSSLFLAALIFVVLVFFYSNLNEQVLNYPLSFEFTIPYILNLKSKPIALGFALIIAFCLGIIFAAFLQFLPALFRRFALRKKDKRIRQLERALDEAKAPLESIRPPLN